MSRMHSLQAFVIPKLRPVVEFLTSQGIVTAARLLSGLLCIRLLPVSEFAKYAVVYGFLGTLALLMDVSFSGTLAPLVGEKVQDLGLIADYTASLRQLAHWIYFAVAPAAVLLYPILVQKQSWSWQVIAGMLAILLIASWCDRLRGTYGAVLIVRRDHRVWNGGQIVAGLGQLAILCVLWAANGLNAFSALLANLAGAVYLAAAYYYRSRRLLGLKGHPSREKRKEIVHLALPNMPTTIFYAFQGQISLIVITIFGHSTAVASLGALNRLSQVYLLFGLLNPYLIAPYFAKLSEARLKRNYAGVLLVEGAFALFVTGLARVFPQTFLWVLGHNYSGLQFEVFLVIAGASLAYLNGAMSFIHNARRFVYWWSSAAAIVLTVAVEAIYIWKEDLSTVRGVLLLSLAVVGINFLINFLTGIYGFMWGPRKPAEGEPATAGSLAR